MVSFENSFWLYFLLNNIKLVKKKYIYILIENMIYCLNCNKIQLYKSNKINIFYDPISSKNSLTIFIFYSGFFRHRFRNNVSFVSWISLRKHFKVWSATVLQFQFFSWCFIVEHRMEQSSITVNSQHWVYNQKLVKKIQCIIFFDKRL